MKLSALNLPALVILVTSHTGGLGASIHQSEADALEDVVRELQQDNGAPDDLEPTISAISDWIGDVDLIYEFSVQPLSLPGYRVVAYDHTAGAVLDQRLADTTDLDAAQAFAGMIWNQTGFGRDDVSVFLYRIGGDEPIFTIRNDDERAETPILTDGLPQGYSVEQDTDGDWILLPPSNVTIYSLPGEGIILSPDDGAAALIEAQTILAGLPHIVSEGDRTAFESARGGYWYVDEVQGGERYTIAKNLTEDQARSIEAGAEPFNGDLGAPAAGPLAKVGLILRSGEPWVGDWIGADEIQTAHPSFDAAKAKNAEHGHRWYPYEAHAEEQDGKPGYRLLDKD